MRILVTRGPDLIKPKAGAWPLLEDFLRSKLNKPKENGDAGQGHEVDEQLPFFLGWVCRATHDLYLKGGKFAPNQALILCGAAGVGKNVMQNLVTEVLDRRKADPFANMEGRSDFNGELLGAEHWMIADQQTSTKYNDRARMKAAIKQACVNASMRINAKFGKPVNIEFFRRLTISLNWRKTPAPWIKTEGPVTPALVITPKSQKPTLIGRRLLPKYYGQDFAKTKIGSRIITTTKR